MFVLYVFFIWFVCIVCVMILLGGVCVEVCFVVDCVYFEYVRF